jgi:hypothetical protein
MAISKSLKRVKIFLKKIQQQVLVTRQYRMDTSGFSRQFGSFYFPPIKNGIKTTATF